MDESELILVGKIDTFLQCKQVENMIKNILNQEGIKFTDINTRQVVGANNMGENSQVALDDQVRLISTKAVFEHKVYSKTRDRLMRANVFDLMHRDGNIVSNVAEVLSQSNEEYVKQVSARLEMQRNMRAFTRKLKKFPKLSYAVPDEISKTFQCKCMNTRIALKRIKLKYFGKKKSKRIIQTVVQKAKNTIENKRQVNTEELSTREDLRNNEQVSNYNQIDKSSEISHGELCELQTTCHCLSATYGKDEENSNRSIPSPFTKQESDNASKANFQDNLIYTEYKMSNSDQYIEIDEIVSNRLGTDENIQNTCINNHFEMKHSTSTMFALAETGTKSHTAIMSNKEGSVENREMKSTVEIRENKPINQTKEALISAEAQEKESSNNITGTEFKFSSTCNTTEPLTTENIQQKAVEQCFCAVHKLHPCSLSTSEQKTKCFSSENPSGANTFGGQTRSFHCKKPTSDRLTFNKEYGDKENVIQTLALAQRACCRMAPRGGVEMELLVQQQREARRQRDLSNRGLSKEQMFEYVVRFVESKVQEIVRFAKMIPGFRKLHLDDQVSLIRDSRLDGDVPNIQRNSNFHRRIVTLLPGDHIAYEDFESTFGKEWLDVVGNHAKKSLPLNITEEEEALYRAVVITTSGNSPERKGRPLPSYEDGN